MSEKKYVVPKDGLNAARIAWEAWFDIGMSKEDIWRGRGVEYALEAFIRWLSEHPQVPTDKDLYEMSESCPSNQSLLRYSAIEWQHRMFIAPEPEVPEDIKGMKKIDLSSIKDQDQLNRLVSELNVISFNRGIEKGRKDIINKHDKQNEVQSLLLEEMAKELGNLITRDENLTRDRVDMLISNAFLCGRESVVSIFEEQEKSGKFTKEEIIEGIKSICDSRHGIGEKK